MITITSHIYRAVAQKLLEKIGSADYFNGTIEYDFQDISTTLRATFIVSREWVDEPTGAFERIKDIIPVWWEFNTECCCGQALNDFSWCDFKKNLL